MTFIEPDVMSFIYESKDDYLDSNIDLNKENELLLCSPDAIKLKQMTIHKFKNLRTSGRYSVNDVKLDQIDGERYADKCMSVQNDATMANEVQEQLLREFVLARNLSHKNIAHYKYFLRKYDKKIRTNQFHIITELLHGETLAKHLSGHMGRIITNVDKLQSISAQIVDAMKYIHKLDKMHSNLKLENIQIENLYGKIKLIDLAVPPNFDKNQSDEDFMERIRYMSPEELNGQLSQKTDVWAFGCILFELCSGIKPYHGVETISEIASLLLERKESPLEYAMVNNIRSCRIIFANDDLLQLLQKCFKIDHSKRPSFSKLKLNQPFLNKSATKMENKMPAYIEDLKTELKFILSDR